jgi:rhamnosyl/mannosyltransferase
MVEAMAMGKPIVASDITGSGVPWVNQHGSTGFNVPAGQSGALAQSLRTLLGDDALRERLGQGARQRYELEFAAERMTQRTIDLYRQLLPVPARNEVRALRTDSRHAHS